MILLDFIYEEVFFISTNAQIVGIKLRRFRLQQGYSQEVLAEKAGLHPTYIGQVERGEKNLTIESLSKIAGALSVPVSALFDEFDDNISDENYPFMVYKMMSSLNEKRQEKLYTIVKEIYNMLQ